MNSPPSSISHSAHSDGLPASQPRHARLDSYPISSMAENPSGSGTRRVGPPSPASSSSVIAVGSVNEAALIQSIEQGTYVSGDDVDDTRSLTDSIRQHIVDGGLRYHAYHAGQYSFPNDETEQYCDDLRHHLTLYLCDGDYFSAPLQEEFEKGIEVLDLGTGTGKWCMELADQYPKTTFHGMDLSPIQPDWVPENVLFVVDDIEHEGGWTYPEDKFDMIHIRHTVHAIRNRPELWERIYRHLKPGGYVEIKEFQYTAACDDDSCDGPYAWRDFLRYLKDGLSALGCEPDGILNTPDELRNAGFQGIYHKQLKCPNGPWAKKQRLQECGHILPDVIMMGLSGLARRPLRDGLHWTMVQIEMFLVEVRKSINAEVNGLPQYHAYLPFHSIRARKPLDTPPSQPTAQTS